MRPAWAGRGLLGLAAAGYLAVGQADAQNGFDAQTLRLRGIDPLLAQYLADTPRFSPGVQRVHLTVNGQDRGRVDARFEPHGALCLDARLLEAAGLLTSDPADSACQAFTTRFPETQVELHPGAGEVHIWAPARAVATVTPTSADFSAGGVAGVLNYDVQGVITELDARRSPFWLANTEAGFNAGDWIVRSRQLYASDNGRRRSEHLGASAQKTFPGPRAVLQLGQISLSNPVLPAARIDGVQWTSEPALRPDGGSSRLAGMATTRARVEVHQDGALIYAAVVAPGPFELADIPQLDPRRDAQLSVLEADGERRTVSVLSSSLDASLPAHGFSFGAGRLRELGAIDNPPWVASGGWSQPLSSTTTLSNGLLLAEGYQAVGNGLAGSAWRGHRWQATWQASRQEAASQRGVQGRLSLDQRFGRQWHARVAYLRQSPGHRQLTHSLLDGRGVRGARYRDQYSVGVGWNDARFGSWNSSYGSSTAFDGQRSQRATLNWGQQWGQAAVSLNTEWQLAGAGGVGNVLYLSASLPLGERRRLRATTRRSGDQARFGLALQEQVNERLSYRLGGERSTPDGAVNLNGGLSWQPGATQVDLGYAYYGGGNRSYHLGARGGLVAQEDGLIFSATPVQDTFGVLSVGSLANVEVQAPGGRVWTDRQGRAVLAQLTPYGRSHVEIAPASLPRNVDVRQGVALVRAGRGSVSRVSFEPLTTRRVLLTATDATRQPLPRGATVVNEQGAMITLVQDGGLIFVPDLLSEPRLWVRTESGQRCELLFELPIVAVTAAYFETSTALCRADPASG
jgi:outer membrane usher protein FimD/PapC